MAELQDHVVSGVRVTQHDTYDEIHVWSRGGGAGTLCVCRGDGEIVAERLLPRGAGQVEETRDGVHTREVGR